MKTSEVLEGIEHEDSLDETSPSSTLEGEPPKSVWLNGYVFGLILLAIAGFLLIALGQAVFPQGSLPNVVLIGIGIAMGPAAIVAIVFRVFLFGEIRYELTRPLIREVRISLRGQIRKQINRMVAESRQAILEMVAESKTDILGVIEGYQAEIPLLRQLRKAGIEHVFRSREQALRAMLTEIEEEESEIIVVGSSLKGLLQMESPEYELAAGAIKLRVERGGTPVKFLLTHPAVADLRAGQEQREPSEIGEEIIQSIEILKGWGVPCEHVRLYKGTPTCFAIKTSRKMLLNPYPYAAVAYDSPCFIVNAESFDDRGYFYDAFKIAHFRAYETKAAERITDYNATIMALRDNLKAYALNVDTMLGPPGVKVIQP